MDNDTFFYFLGALLYLWIASGFIKFLVTQGGAHPSPLPPITNEIFCIVVAAGGPFMLLGLLFDRILRKRKPDSEE